MVGIVREHTSPKETIQAFMDQIFARLQLPSNGEPFEVRRTADRFFSAFLVHKDFGTAYLYVHPSRTTPDRPLSWTEESFRQYGAWNYYSDLQPERVMVVEVQPLPSWHNPYDGIEYTGLYEVRVRLERSSEVFDNPIDNYFRSVWQKVDGQWFVFVSKFGFEQGPGRMAEGALGIRIEGPACGSDLICDARQWLRATAGDGATHIVRRAPFRRK